MEIHDMPKIECPFIRKKMPDGRYLITSEIKPEYEWVFTDDKVMAIEKLHGTNVSILIEHGQITQIWNRTTRLPFFNNGRKFIIEGLLNSYERGYTEFLPDGQHFGELLGPKVNGNPYRLTEHIWIPFNTYAQKHLRYKSWGKYPKDFDTISAWFKEDLIPLYASLAGQDHDRKNGFVEGVVFTHPDGRMAKIRRDMFSWYVGKNHKESN